MTLCILILSLAWGNRNNLIMLILPAVCLKFFGSYWNKYKMCSFSSLFMMVNWEWDRSIAISCYLSFVEYMNYCWTFILVIFETFSMFPNWTCGLYQALNFYGCWWKEVILSKHFVGFIWTWEKQESTFFKATWRLCVNFENKEEWL